MGFAGKIHKTIYAGRNLVVEYYVESVWFVKYQWEVYFFNAKSDW